MTDAIAKAIKNHLASRGWLVHVSDVGVVVTAGSHKFIVIVTGKPAAVTVQRWKEPDHPTVIARLDINDPHFFDQLDKVVKDACD
jgi:hypothetical protein